MQKNKKWLMWILLLPTYFISFFHRTALSPIGNLLMNQFNVLDKTATILGIMTSVYFFTYGFMQFPSGYLADKIGPRKIVSIGSIVMGLGTILFAYSKNLHFAYFGRFIIGFGASFNFLSLLRIQSNWFKEKEFPFLTGITIFIGNSGALFGLGPFAYLTDLIGLNQSLIIFGIIPVIFGILIYIFLKDKPEYLLHEKYTDSFIDTFKKVLKEKNNYLSMLAFGLSNGAYLTFVGFCNIPFLMHIYGLSKIEASVMTTFVTLGAVIGCLFNWLKVKLFRVPKHAGIFFLSIALFFWLFIALIKIPEKLLWIYYILYFLFGIALSALNLIFTNVRFNNKKEITASALAFTNFGGFISIAVLQFIGGFILDLFIDQKMGTEHIIYPYEAYKVLFIILTIIHFFSIITYAFTKKEALFERK
ncbi:MAG: MFS transporter [Spirochaetes bacterium]|nr:MFS transporter [Spirochaetota bacterium]